jgi:uncharacterized protein (TIGR00369 family)
MRGASWRLSAARCAPEKNSPTSNIFTTMTPAAQLAAWIAEEKTISDRLNAGPGVGVARPDQIAGKTGLELMHAMIRGELPYPPVAKTMSFQIIEVAPGHAVFQGQPLAEHFNPLGTVHGGWFATLLDSALGCAVHTMMPAGRAYTTAELNINLVKALTPKVERVRAIGEVIHCGRQLATAEARLVGPDGTLYAHGTTTCLVFDMR